MEGDRRGDTSVFWIELALVATIALVVRLAHIGSADPWYDEFYHMLAARSWLVDGSLSIAFGEYHRASLFTRMVAGSLAVFGDSMAAGRIPAVVAGTLWVVAVFGWTRHVAGRGAAWAAGLFLALDPGAIHLSERVRFYSLHGLLAWIVAISIYTVVTEPRTPRRAMAIGTVGLAALFVAHEFLPSTLIVVGAGSIWAAAVLAPRVPDWFARSRTHRWSVIGAGAALAAGITWAFATGTVAYYWEGYTGGFFWQEGTTASSRWYVWWLGGQYETLWTLFPVAVVLAVARNPRPAIFAVTMFVVSFTAVSFAAGQQERYVYFTIPFFFVIWAMAIATLVPALRAAVARALASLPLPRWASGARAGGALVLTVLAVAFVVGQNDAPRATVRMVFPGDGPRPYRLADWEMALPALRPLVDSADVVLSSYVLKPLYYFDRGDYHLSWSETAEAGFVDGRPVEFAHDPRTGLPAISSPESLARVIRCFRSGIVLTERFHLDRPHLVPEATTAFLLGNTEEVPLPPDSWVLAYRWRHEAAPSDTDCGEVQGNAVLRESRSRYPDASARPSRITG